MDDLSFSIFPNENFLDLRLYQYGWEQCAPLHSFGPFVRNHFLFHYVISGQGFLNSNAPDGTTHRYDLAADQGFLICPGQVNTYCADKDQPWKYVWLEFDGLRVTEYLTYAGLDASHPVYTPQSTAQGQALRDSMLYIANHSKVSTLHLIGHLFLFLDALVQSSASRRSASGGPAAGLLHPGGHHLHGAELPAGSDRGGAGRCVQAQPQLLQQAVPGQHGLPPQEFLIRMRLSKATELMKTSRASIGDIAQMCGYPNQLHFSRAFKKRYGVSPRAWRAENQFHAKG